MNEKTVKFQQSKVSMTQNNTLLIKSYDKRFCKKIFQPDGLIYKTIIITSRSSCPEVFCKKAF